MLWDVLSKVGISYTLVIVLIGAGIVGFMSGLLSVFFVLEKKSVMGDTIAHSSLPGVVIAFLLLLEKSQLFFAIGALISSFLAILFIRSIITKSVLNEDVAIGVTLAIFFGIGIALLTYVQSSSVASQAGLMNYIFGNIAFLLRSDLYLLGIIAVIDFLIVSAFWKEYKIIIFDREYAKIIGIPVRNLDLVMTGVISLTIIVGIQIIGVIMIAGLLIAPAVGARQWTNSYGIMISLSSVFGIISGIAGTILSANIPNLPPGPTIIVMATIIAIFSIFFGHKNGVLVNWFHTNFSHRKVDHNRIIQDFLLSTNALDKSEGLTKLEFSISDYPELTKEIIDNLERCGYCKWLSDDKCVMTLRGVEMAKDYFLKEED